MAIPPTYVRAIMTEAQLERLKDLVKASLQEMGHEAEGFEEEVRLLGALLSPEKVNQAA